MFLTQISVLSGANRLRALGGMSRPSHQSDDRNSLFDAFPRAQTVSNRVGVDLWILLLHLGQREIFALVRIRLTALALPT